jgi:hypothetical protein
MPLNSLAAATEPLWVIEEELEMLLDAVDTCPEELTEELERRIEEYVTKEAEKVDRLSGVLISLEHVQLNAKAEIDRLRARASQAERAEDRLKHYILEVLRKREGRPLKGKHSTLSVRTAESLIITDLHLVPDEWKVTTVTTTAPKDPIKRAIKAGQEIPGVAIQVSEHLVRK